MRLLRIGIHRRVYCTKACLQIQLVWSTCGDDRGGVRARANPSGSLLPSQPRAPVIEETGTAGSAAR